MSERENNVYKAKLAEQAERYDGEQNQILFHKIWMENLSSHRIFQIASINDDGRHCRSNPTLTFFFL